MSLAMAFGIGETPVKILIRCMDIQPMESFLYFKYESEKSHRVWSISKYTISLFSLLMITSSYRIIIELTDETSLD